MNEDNLQVINNKKIEDLLKQVLAARVINDDLFEEKIVDLLEPYPDISKDQIDEVLLYYTLKVAAERVSQPHKSKGYTESTLTTYESFNPRLRHLYIAGKYKSPFDLNISKLSRLLNASVDVIAKMLNEITVPIKAKVEADRQEEDALVSAGIAAETSQEEMSTSAEISEEKPPAESLVFAYAETSSRSNIGEAKDMYSGMLIVAVWGNLYDEKVLAKEPITQKNMKEARAEK